MFMIPLSCLVYFGCIWSTSGHTSERGSKVWQLSNKKNGGIRLDLESVPIPKTVWETFTYGNSPSSYEWENSQTFDWAMFKSEPLNHQKVYQHYIPHPIHIPIPRCSMYGIFTYIYPKMAHFCIYTYVYIYIYMYIIYHIQYIWSIS